MNLVIHLLGAPCVALDGSPQPPPRGNKPWGLLTYLLLTSAPVSRAHLSTLLFADADDPLATLRWNLSQVRRLLGPGESLGGDPVVVQLDAEALVDARTVVSGTWERAAALPGVGHDLLGAMSFPGCPSFEVWLETEPRHLRGATESLLHEGALASLAQGDAQRAADLAGHLVWLIPYDEDFQSLLVRALATAGEGVAAARQVAACRELFRRELGCKPGPALAAAAATVTATPTAPASGGSAAVAALLEAGIAAIGAGAVEPGLQCLRRAVTDARSMSDRGLEARALASLGGALVHAVRGRDEEGAMALHQAVATAHPSYLRVVADACRELGYVEFLRARYDRVESWLHRAESAAGDDLAQLAKIATVRGITASDIGSYDLALVALTSACADAADDRDAAYA